MQTPRIGEGYQSGWMTNQADIILLGVINFRIIFGDGASITLKASGADSFTSGG